LLSSHTPILLHRNEKKNGFEKIALTHGNKSQSECMREKNETKERNKRILASSAAARLIGLSYPEGFIFMTVLYKNKSFYLCCDGNTGDRTTRWPHRPPSYLV
jgi:hypothetical protein